MRFWLTFDPPLVDRRTYLAHGFGLAVLKYAGDLAIVAATTGRLWTPVDYLHSVRDLLSTTFDGAPSWLMPALFMWTLPFLWAGVTLTVRRAVDAGWPAWFALGFFVPYLNYALMALLCAVPSAGASAVSPAKTDQDAQVVARDYYGLAPGAFIGIFAGAAIGILTITLGLPLFGRYGFAMFLGTPFVMGALTGFLLNRLYAATAAQTTAVTCAMFAVVVAGAIVLGSEGAVCLAMAIPISLPVGLMGATLGRRIATGGDRDLKPALFALLVLPLSSALEPRHATGRVVHEVRSSIEIDAAPEQVWDHVIAFQPIPEPADLVFRLGIAFPQYARIAGAGVGAVRYCVFSTGAFVEPITRWEPGRRLAFDVVRSPAPLRELSPYANVSPPHLDGYLRSRRGEFRLVALDGRTRLEGRTWYELEMAPEGYWQIFSDDLIRRIHLRVLAHIKREVEAGILAASVAASGGNQQLYFSKTAHVPLGTTPLVFGTHDAVDVALELRTPSVEERDRFPPLVISDYRVDVPNYYADKRAPNVRFEVMEVVGGHAVWPASYRVATQGDRGKSSQYLTADVWFQLGRSRSTYWLVDHLWYLGALLFGQHSPGTYQIRAFYREFVTPAILVIVK